MEDAVTQQCADFKPKWLREALDELDHYITDPFTTDFMKKYIKYGLKILPTKKAMHNLIQRKVAGSKKPPHFEDLVEYVDELKPWGKQCVSLYALRYTEKEYLKQLLDPGYIKERLSEFNLEDRYNNNICRWKSDTPFLSEVSHNFDYDKKRGWLSFKWIQTRKFKELVGDRLKTFEERSVNFFIIDLEDGSAQLRIQSLPSRPLKKIEQELQAYTEEIEKLLEFHRFSPVSLEPVMKQFLFKKVLPITSWSVKTKKGELRGSKVSPAFVERRLTLPFQGVTPHEIQVYWKCQQEVGNRNRLFFALEAEDNVIVFNAITDKPRVNYLLSSLLATARLHSKDEKIDIYEVLGIHRPALGILQGGFRDWIKHKASGTPHERLKKVAAEVAILPPLVLNRVIFDIITTWLEETIVEKITNIPFIAFELLVYVILLIIFYGGDRVRKYFFRIPAKYATAVIRLILGQSSEIIINSREYYKWLTGKAT